MARSVSAFFLGGTISMSGHSAPNGGAVTRSGADELVAAVPQLADLGVVLEARDFRQVPSASLSFDDIIELVAEATACESDGIVIVQGTDTLEETAYLIDLLWSSDRPIVLTGAMRNPSLAGADGPANLVAAVTVAASDVFGGLGALVVFGDEVHGARHVRKTHTTSTDTFKSPNAGPLGMVVEGRPIAVSTTPRRQVFEPSRGHVSRVPLYLVGLDDDASVPTAVGDLCDGMVVAALGAGHVPARVADVLAGIAWRAPVVLASRATAGPVLSHTYGYVGSETDLLGRGLIGAGLLDPLKARVLVKVALASGYDLDQIRVALAHHGGLG